MLKKLKRKCKHCQKPIQKILKNKNFIGISKYCSIGCWLTDKHKWPEKKEAIVKFEEGDIFDMIPPSRFDNPVEMVVTKVDKKRKVVTIEKTKPDRDKEYLAFVHKFPCCACGAPEVQAHHVEHSGLGLKGSDYSVIALCINCHNEIHSIGIEKFITEYRPSFDVQREQIKVLRAYIRWLQQKNQDSEI